ncbi:MAG: hypothetical protein DWQ07_23215 [Chloroflexi bacterium]|nr:MAG: hypothetical protein DWQ07_23215 [Chloroflexota bacterium]MBL1194060.1 hypothetical protein [Chloroflexota bacterium]
MVRQIYLLILVSLMMIGCSRIEEQQIAFHTGTVMIDAQIYVVDLNGQNLTQLTDSRGSNSAPTWSPDGSQIAFVSTRDTNFEIYIMNADGSGQYNFTESRAHDRNPTWSPDGKWILFESRVNDTEYRDLYRKNVETGELVQLTDTPELAEFHPAWSTDGSQIAFSVLNKDAALDIYIMDKDGGNVERITGEIRNVDYPIWGRSGDKIYFVTFGWFEVGKREIVAYDLETGELSQISFDGQPKGEFVITPDGSNILFESSVEIGQNEDGIRLTRGAIFVMNIDGTGLELLPIYISASGVAWRP